MRWEDIAEAIGRTVSAVGARWWRTLRHSETSNSIDRPIVNDPEGGPCAYWTPREDAALGRLGALGTPWPDIAAQIGRSEAAVKHRWFSHHRDAAATGPDDAQMDTSEHIDQYTQGIYRSSRARVSRPGVMCALSEG